VADLSSAAQAVLDAWEAKLDPMVTCLTHDPEREALAAALRAVADQLGYGDGSGDPIINEHELLAIADELDAQ